MCGRTKKNKFCTHCLMKKFFFLFFLHERKYTVTYILCFKNSMLSKDTYTYRHTMWLRALGYNVMTWKSLTTYVLRIKCKWYQKLNDNLNRLSWRFLSFLFRFLTSMLVKRDTCTMFSPLVFSVVGWIKPFFFFKFAHGNATMRPSQIYIYTHLWKWCFHNLALLLQFAMPSSGLSGNQ